MLVSFEALAWTAGLVYLACCDPRSANHFTLWLPWHLFGIRSPGYNLGHAVAWLFRGDLARSVEAHWLGIPAVLILGHRVVQLTRRRISQFRKEPDHG